MKSEKFEMDELVAFVTDFVKEHPEATIHIRKNAHRDGRFRIFFQVKNPDSVESWEQDESLVEENSWCPDTDMCRG